MNHLTARLARIGAATSSPVAYSFVTMVIVFFMLPAANGYDVSTYNLYSAMQIFGTYGLIALALGITMIAAQFDLSTLGMFVLGGLVAVKVGGDSPSLGVIAALGVGALAGLIQGLIVAKLSINSMSVTLGGFLVLLGLSRAIGNDATVSYDNFDVGISLDSKFAVVMSWHSVIVLLCFLFVGLAMAWTTVGRNLKAVGGDARASRVSGVGVTRVIVGVFVLSGLLSGLAGALNAFSLAAALANPGFAPLVFGATSALIGGVGLAGGRGTVTGIALGAVALSLLQAMFGILASPSWVTSVVTGGLLVLVATAAAPRLAAIVARLAARHRRRYVESAVA
ncbi:ribose/xylose/arabinose/galactoside ABC-type transport system permease subunit [Nocardioides ginsengisegetis]|uniref:Ribose/xylose/arabinose/galactoside ABC-type transport system permease subunit n=1 Tax=Nocardioides ginsengisegetis TaxID=661491 RepID=A0A7W3P938_9ACTN|nr:hypothetical protein [Nocardioides ginsengisegetis]MBA8803280.1 ribose/xylose/arabinose/galactoside ABC-type transport system permease subunit [Nocardioides ginsengisegetis]